MPTDETVPCGVCGHEEEAHVGDDPNGKVCAECDGAGWYDIMLHPYVASTAAEEPTDA